MTNNDFSNSAELPISTYYKKYKEEEKELFKLNRFEKLCKFSSRFLKVRAPMFIKNKLDKPIYMSDLKVNSDEVFSFFLFSFFASFLLLSPLLILLEFPTNILIILGLPAFLAYNALSYPILYSDIIRIKAGNETVNIILYMVIYLSLNPVFEKAVQFAAVNCYGPIGKDFKKIMWDIELGKYTTMEEALGAYSKKWTIWNDEFVTSLITLQMVGAQPSAERRREILDEALDKTLSSTYAKMKEYATNLKIPSIMLLSFGIVLPLMGLVMFPLLSIFLTHSVNPVYLVLGYVIILPSFLWWYLNRLISKRPSAFSHSEKTGGVKPNKYIYLPKLKLKIPIKLTAILIGLIIALPGIFYCLQLYFDYSYYHTNYPPHEAKDKWRTYCLNRYGKDVILGDVFKAIFIVWGVSIAIIFYCYFRSKKKYELEEYIRKTEEDFEVGLFELQSALTQNIPIELAVPNVLNKYERMNKKGSPMYVFFDKIYSCITQLSMTFEQALFNEEVGVLKDFPSSLIKSIMKVISASLSKGPMIVSNAARNIINYLKKTRDIENMIKDLLQDVISNLNVQTTFILPLISGIVASIGVLIVQLLQSLSSALARIEKITSFGANVGGSSYSPLSSTLSLIKLEEIMPPTILELTAGIYLIECAIIMCIFLVGIQRGFDEVSRDYTIAKNLTIAVIFFTIIFFIMVIVFQPIIARVGAIS